LKILEKDFERENLVGFTLEKQNFPKFSQFLCREKAKLRQKKENTALHTHDNTWVKKLQGDNPTKGQSRYNPSFLKYIVK
jgi:hypothetical protein